MLPEEKARVKIDKQLTAAGWDIVARDEYIPFNASAVKEALMQGNKESDYLLFVDDKAIAVVEAKAEDNSLGDAVAQQAEWYSQNPQGVGLWYPNQIPFVYLANGNKIYFKNMLDADSEYVELAEMHSPKKMLQMLGKKSEYGALPRIEKKGLRDCQYDAEVKLEASLKAGKKKALAILATGSGKTYLACLASYRLLNYTPTKRVLFLVDRNNLARQTETEFSLFNRTENNDPLNKIYQINRLRKPEDVQGDIVISTIQKLFAVLTGQNITDDDEDKEDEKRGLSDNIKNEPAVELGSDLKLPPDYFQFIIVDECHRSIYGKWKAVLDYFKDAKILGLTATPIPEAQAYFNENIVENYTFEKSVIDDVNVPARVYRIITEATVHGGTIKQGETVTDVNRAGEVVDTYTAQNRIDYAPNQLDRSVINPNQIESVLKAYMDSIYTDLYPEREENWNYIPKTLIFAKDDNHATKIVEVAKKVFAEKFADGKVPDNFVQKITYSAGDSNALIRELRTEKDFRIAVTVTLVATGTDVKPLEVVLFMNHVKSDVLYTQMKGRGCRKISDDKLKEITPNANIKDCFYIVDAVGVTEEDHTIPHPGKDGSSVNPKPLRLDQLLERLSHGEVSDANLALLRDYCATIHNRYEGYQLFEKHLNSFIADYGFSPKKLAIDINDAISENTLPPYDSISDDNIVRKNLIFCLTGNIQARRKLLEMQCGYKIITPPGKDPIIYKGFSKEIAKSFIANFEQYLKDNADTIEALRIIYNSEDTVITYSMLTELQEKLIAENKQYVPDLIWTNYKILDNDGSVDDLDTNQNIKALTHLIQLVRYAYKKSDKLVSLLKGYSQRFNLYCGQAQRELTDDQKEIMKQIADYIIKEGAISTTELNSSDTDLWRRAVKSFGIPALTQEIITLSKFILKAA